MRLSLPPLLPVVVFAALVSGCTGANPRVAREELLAVDQKFAAEVAEKGIAVYESYYAEDAVELPAFQPMVEGKGAIIDFYRPFFNDPTAKLTWRPTRAEVSTNDDLGFTIGHYQVTKTDDKGVMTTRTGKYVTIWRRGFDGGWKVVLDGGSPDQRPATTP